MDTKYLPKEFVVTNKNYVLYKSTFWKRSKVDSFVAYLCKGTFDYNTFFVMVITKRDVDGISHDSSLLRLLYPKTSLKPAHIPKNDIC